MCAFVCVSVVCTCAQECLHIWRPEVDADCLSQSLLTLLLRQYLYHLNPEHSDQGRLVCLLQEFPLYPIQVLECIWVFPNSSPCICLSHNLHNKPYQPQGIFVTTDFSKKVQPRSSNHFMFVAYLISLYAVCKSLC